MRTTELLIKKLKEFEGLRLEAYIDAAGVPTIGYGHTKGVRICDRITPYWADELLKKDVAQVEYEVSQLGVARTPGQMDALVSFAFNLGIGRLLHSTLLKCIREGRSMHVIRKEFLRWVNANGKPMPGLKKRREWEAKRFFE